MASIISAGTTSATALNMSADTTGVLQLASNNGTVALTISTAQNVTFVADASINGLTVGRGAGAVASNTAVGASALAANTSGSENTSSGYQSLFSNTTGSFNSAYGVISLKLNTSGSYNNAFGDAALANNTTGSYNFAGGVQALYSNTTASNNTAVGYQAGYSNTTGADNLFVGYQAGFSNATGTLNTYLGRWAGKDGTGNNNTLVGINTGYQSTGSQNTFVGARSTSGSCAEAMTTGSKNTILGAYSGNQGGLNITTSSNYIVLSDGDGNPRLQYVYVSASLGYFRVASNTTADSTNLIFRVDNASGGSDILCEAGNTSPTAISGVMRISKITANGRSINAAGTINQNGADYAEYMVKSGSFTIAKGDVCGINAEGKLTNMFADAISFCVKSTDPGLVGGDSWFTEPRPKDENNNELASDTQEYAAWFARMEAARATVDRIAFCGQVPVNLLGATAGQYIVPVNDNGAIKGVAKNEADLTMSDYIKSVGKVIAIEADGRAKIIVKVA